MDGRAPYLVMEYIEGDSLAQRLLQEEALPDGDVVRILGEVGGALRALHDAEVIHRDLKPSNVMIRADDGSAVLMDLGLALPPDATALTRTDVVVGTPLYMPPEVLDGRPWSPASDQFQLAALAYRALAGHPHVEIEGVTPVALVLQILEGRWRPLASPGGSLPPDLETAILRALSIDPGSRYPDIGSFVRAAEPVGRPATRPQTAPPRPSVVSPPPALSSPEGGVPPAQGRAPGRGSTWAGLLGLLLGVGSVALAPPPATVGPPEVTAGPPPGEIQLAGPGTVSVRTGTAAALWWRSEPDQRWILGAGLHLVDAPIATRPVLRWASPSRAGEAILEWRDLAEASVAALERSLEGMPLEAMQEAAPAAEDRAHCEAGRRAWLPLLPWIPRLLTDWLERPARAALFERLQRWRLSAVQERALGGEPTLLDSPAGTAGWQEVGHLSLGLPPYSGETDLKTPPLAPIGDFQPPPARRAAIQKLGITALPTPNALRFEWPPHAPRDGLVLLEFAASHEWDAQRFRLIAEDDGDLPSIDAGFFEVGGGRLTVYRTLLPADLMPEPGAPVRVEFLQVSGEYAPVVKVGPVLVCPWSPEAAARTP
jgi:hypothetical protein